MPNCLLRQTIAQPIAGLTQYGYLISGDAYLLVQLSVDRILGRFTNMNAALGELPGVVAANTAGPQHPTSRCWCWRRLQQHDAHVGPKSVLVDCRTHNVVLCAYSTTIRMSTLSFLAGG